MKEEIDYKWIKLFHKIRELEGNQKALREQLDSIQKDLWKLEELSTAIKFIPDMILQKLGPILTAYSPTPATNTPKTYKYQPHRKDSWTWKEHILFTLHFEDRPLRTSELVDIHVQLKVKGKDNRKYVQRDISKNLTALVKDERVIKYKPKGATKFVYCLPKWFEESGELMRKYKGRSHYF